MTCAINPADFHRALLKGAHRVEGKQEELNRINAFPVPDRDTGSNLAYLMSQLRAKLPPSMDYGELLTHLSKASLMGARGNSGAIFSQYFSGFGQASIPVKQDLRLIDLAKMFRQGYDNAYRSIQQPMEGTILSAMRSFSDVFMHVINQLGDLRTAAEAALSRLRETVVETMTVLPQQKALKAPDAGAMGFMYFAEGFLRSLLGDAEESADEEDNLPLYTLAEVADHTATEDLAFRYCTEVMVRLLKTEELPISLRERLNALGDSLVFSHAGQMMRVHLHTNEPAQLVDLLSQYGELVETKADDMQMQQALSRIYPGETALVVDSIADVPPQLLGEHTYVLPLNLLADGVSYQDRRTISPQRISELSGRLSSSQLNLQEVRQFMDPILKRYDRVIVITVSSRMSDLYDRFREYLDGIDPGRVRLVDSKLNSAAEGLLALHAANRLKEGAGLEELADELEKKRERLKILVSLPDLKAMIASGRLNKRIGKVLQGIGYLPLVTINQKGEGTVTGLSFSHRSNLSLLKKRVAAATPKEYAVVHFGAEDCAQALARDLKHHLGFPTRYISDISAVVANFSGVGACAVAYLEADHLTEKAHVK